MNLWLLALIVAVAAAAAAGVMHLVRSRSKIDRFFIEIERGAGIFAFLGTAFAVILAFVVLEAFQSFNDAKSGAEEEATTLLQLSRTAEFFPAAEYVPIEGVLICYGRAVINDEWPAMKEGRRSPVVQTWVVQVQNGLKQLHPETPQEEVAFLKLLDQQDTRTDARRTRLSEANRALPAPVWFFLGLGALTTVGFAFFFADRREHFIVQGSLIAAITGLVVSGLLLVWFLDHPYENRSGSIKPDEMELGVAIVEREHKDAAPPCDENGHPVDLPAYRPNRCFPCKAEALRRTAVWWEHAVSTAGGGSDSPICASKDGPGGSARKKVKISVSPPTPTTRRLQRRRRDGVTEPARLPLSPRASGRAQGS